MPSERIQRRIEQLLDDADAAMVAGAWADVRARCQAVLAFDPQNADALTYLEAAVRGEQAGGTVSGSAPGGGAGERQAPPLPASFAQGRYQVLGLLGEGGRKVVYRARDTVLKREVAFALIKTDGLDDAGRVRVRREAELLAQLGTHPNVVTIFELGEDAGRPYLVSEFLSGGDLAQLIAEAPDHRLPLPRVLELATAVAKGLAYAHSHGVVHRDLKPGNIWLADDGTPKLGDFGLAIADTDARLTQAGLIAGTALYMAPEQATGGDVTPKSDLYSLGCLLYELVTGRPPFVGDESVAIIGQHLDANPVSPSWHRPDCPSALEALILHLLEKAPHKRPSSAPDVAEALAAITPTARRSTSESRRAAQAPSGPSPVYQRAFVGREQELRQLEAAVDAAVSGQGGLVMVVGEPGIGKTSLTEQLATYAGLRGGRVLVGHCYEEGSLSLPYLPFVEALRTYVLEREPAQLKSELGSAAPELARIVSEVRDRVQVEPSASGGDGAEDRYRLLQGICSFLRNASQVQPLVLVLEDLHDADRGTLDLLQYLARQLMGARLLVVGTYRDVEVDRQHPLSAALAEFRRASSFSRVLLRGLTADEVQRMIAAIAGQETPWALAETVHRQTEGNPLFVQEVVRYIAESGLAQRKDGRWQAISAESLLMSIPEGLRDVIGRRLSRLGAECNRLLTIAAVIGRDFQLSTLLVVSAEPEERVAELLDEAVKVAVLGVQAQRARVQYRFAHAFFRQTLYEELSPPRRLRLHQQVARALEQQYAARPEEHAAELAEHFAHSTDADDLRKAVQFGRVAAERATSVYAHSEAARLLEQALEVQEVLDPDDRATRCDLLLALGSADTYTTEPERATDAVAPQAYALAEALGDDDLACAAALVAIGGLEAQMAGAAWWHPAFRQWVQRLDQHAQPGTAARVRADLGLFGMASGQRHHAEGRPYAQRALAGARALGDRALLGLIVGMLVVVPGDLHSYETRLQLLDEFGDEPSFPRPASPGYLPGFYYLAAAPLCFAWGQRDRAEAFWQRLLTALEQTRSTFLPMWGSLVAAIQAYVAGELTTVVEMAQRAFEQAEAVGAGGTGRLYRLMVALRPLLLLGRYEAALQLVGPVGGAAEVLCLARAGRVEEARQALRTSDLARRLLGPEEDASGLVSLLEAAVLLQERELVGLVAERLVPIAGLASVGGVPDSVVARHLGAAAAILGEREHAKQYSAQALAVAEQVRFRPEVALSRLQLAELLSEGDEAELAAAHEQLTFVLPELAAMGMQPALERARALQTRLNPMATATAEELPDGNTAPVPAVARTGQVFISYSSDDHIVASALDAKLTAEQIPVWLDKRSIPPGSSWDAEIVKGIRSSAVVAVLVSPKAMASGHVRQELRLAMEFHKPVLPLLVLSTEYPDEVKYVLAGRQWIEVLERPREDWLGQVLAAVRRLG